MRSLHACHVHARVMQLVKTARDMPPTRRKDHKGRHRRRRRRRRRRRCESRCRLRKSRKEFDVLAVDGGSPITADGGAPAHRMRTYATRTFASLCLPLAVSPFFIVVPATLSCAARRGVMRGRVGSRRRRKEAASKEPREITSRDERADGAGEREYSSSLLKLLPASARQPEEDIGPGRVPTGRRGEPPAIFLIHPETNGRPRVRAQVRTHARLSRHFPQPHGWGGRATPVDADRRLPTPLRVQMSPLRDSRRLFLAYPPLRSRQSLFVLHSFSDPFLLTSLFLSLSFFLSSVFSVVLRCFGIIIVSHGWSVCAPWGLCSPRISRDRSPRVTLFSSAAPRTSRWNGIDARWNNTVDNM